MTRMPSTSLKRPQVAAYRQIYRQIYRQKTSALTGAEDALGLRGGYSPRRTNEKQQKKSKAV